MALGLKNGESPAALPAGVKQLFRNDYITVFLDEPRHLVRFVRSATPFPDLEILRRTYEILIALCEGLDRPRLSLLTDIRAAPGRNDSAFETLMEPLRKRAQIGFARRGTLVATAIGAMHARRLTREEGLERLVSTDEVELLHYLQIEPLHAATEPELDSKSGAKSG